MIHMAAQRGSITEAFETLVDLQHAGLIRHLGVLGAVLLRYVRQPELAPAGADLAELLGRSARLGSFVVPVQPNERLGQVIAQSANWCVWASVSTEPAKRADQTSASVSEVATGPVATVGRY
ncbi:MULTISPECIES: hypothetical protein [Streptomyces]|uniref:hypothetical protein n=1 Tax=Streptomyces TaxID=1883 RepID=UPI000491050B|nr:MULTISPECIES: hypothetical protein [unclassified Streptomyces]MYY19943.1 hypothetical protein [Streptomyces sp. SID4912]